MYIYICICIYICLYIHVYLHLYRYRLTRGLQRKECSRRNCKWRGGHNCIDIDICIYLHLSIYICIYRGRLAEERVLAKKLETG